MSRSPMHADYMSSVRRYADQYGRSWRKCLADHWARETLNPPRDSRDASDLRCIRNHPGLNLLWLNSRAPLEWPTFGEPVRPYVPSVAFRDLPIGSTFDFNDGGLRVSFSDPCVKIGPRKYRSLHSGLSYTVGTPRCRAYNVGKHDALKA